MLASYEALISSPMPFRMLRTHAIKPWPTPLAKIHRLICFRGSAYHCPVSWVSPKDVVS